MRYEGARWRLDLPLPSLPGPHQIANAGTAIACLEQLSGFSLPAGTRLGRGSVRRRIMWSSLVTSALQPGSITVVALASRISAGPAMLPDEMLDEKREILEPFGK